MRLGKRERAERREAACQRALTLGACTEKRLESIRTNGRDRRPWPHTPEATAGPAHAPIRGPRYDADASGAPSGARLPHATAVLPCAWQGWTHALVEPMQTPKSATLSCAERRGLLVDRESTERTPRRRTTRVPQAKRRQTACLAALDYRHPRGLDKALSARRATGPWVRKHPHVLSTAPTGMGHTRLACALGHHACRAGLTVL
jgi:IstB-like ATP binding protein